MFVQVNLNICNMQNTLVSNSLFYFSLKDNMNLITEKLGKGILNYFNTKDDKCYQFEISNTNSENYVLYRLRILIYVDKLNEEWQTLHRIDENYIRNRINDLIFEVQKSTAML